MTEGNGNRRRVRVLSDALANRIAAGEVVQRPANAVKELIENAVDAGASRIRVGLRGAGVEELTVADDGEGMDREDALLALQRHATSKISSDEDLEHIATLGFRGEALPSIAAVSRFQLSTCVAGATLGTEITVTGGRIERVGEVAAATGTEVRVQDLFYNVPARRKFLKSPATEQRNVVATVTQQTMVHFEIGFELRTENRSLLLVPAGQSLEERVLEVVGPEVPGGLFWHRVERDGVHLWFAYAPPHEGRGHRQGLRLFVNERPVQDKLLVRAVMEGYRGLLESRRYPVALLWLHLPPQEVDVNVHPAKQEVRFRDEGRVFRLVAGLVGEALSTAPWAGGGGQMVRPQERWEAPSGAATSARHASRVAEALETYARHVAGAPSLPPSPRSMGWAGSGPAPRDDGDMTDKAPNWQESELGLESTPSRLGALRYIGSFDATYLIFEALERRELVLLDQHAAHERVLYERLQDGAARGRTQPLLLPVVVECSAEELAAAEALGEVLHNLGFEVESFGTGSLKVSASPADLTASAVEPVLRDLLAAVELTEPGVELQQRLDAAAQRAACSGAVKARARLEASEVETLLRDLEGLRNPTHCPHGRPLLCRVPRGEIETLFHRR